MDKKELETCGGVIPSAAGNKLTNGHAGVTWSLAPVNPEYKAYMADLTAGKEVPAIMPHRFDLKALAASRKIPPGVHPSIPLGLRSFSFPSSYDLRTLGKVTPAKISDCGSCWTTATFGSLESNLAPNEIWDFSENHMQLNSWDTAVCGSGGNVDEAIKYLTTWRGPVNEADFDYTNPAPQNPKVQKHVQNAFYIPREGPLDNDWLKSALMSFGGVYTSGSRSFGFNMTYNTYYNPVKYCGHACTIVGWDDNFDRNKFFYNHPEATEEQKVPPGDGAFIVKDSQGPDWGENGYFYVSYYDNAFGTSMAVFTAEPVTNYHRIYQHDPLGTNDFLYIAKTTGGPAYAANIFTAVAADDLSAVGFFVFEGDTYGGFPKYTIQVYLNPVNGPLPLNKHTRGIPDAAVDITLPLAGYYTIKLPKKIPLKRGQKFSVVLSGLSGDGFLGAAVSLERPIWGYSTATAKPGQGYVSPDGLSWQDITTVKKSNTELLTDTSICIKAFTEQKRSFNCSLSGLEKKSAAWIFTNQDTAVVSIKPVVQLSRKKGQGFMTFDGEVTADHYLDNNGISHKARDGWVEVPPGETLTIYSKPGSLTNTNRMAYNYYSVDPISHQILLSEPWKYKYMVESPLHVFSTEPMNNDAVNYPLNLLRVTFDAAIKPGPGLNAVSVMTSDLPHETKICFNSVSSNTLLVALVSSIYISQDPGAGKRLWKVHIPVDAVTDMDGNPLNQNYDWSFTTGLAY